MSTEISEGGGRSAERDAAPKKKFRRAKRQVDPAKEKRDREDTELMLAFKGGDARAFERLLTRHRKPVYNFCFRMLGNRTAAEDALQDIFLKMVRSAKSWEQKAKFTTWMYTIARNHCIDALRKSKYRKTASLDQSLKGEEEDASTLKDRIADEQAVAPDRGAESIRLRATLADAIASLSDDQREVFVMREYAGMPFKEIAQVMGVPENTVKSRMRYALQHLRTTLAKHGIGKDVSRP